MLKVHGLEVRNDFACPEEGMGKYCISRISCISLCFGPFGGSQACRRFSAVAVHGLEVRDKIACPGGRRRKIAFRAFRAFRAFHSEGHALRPHFVHFLGFLAIWGVPGLSKVQCGRCPWAWTPGQDCLPRGEEEKERISCISCISLGGARITAAFRAFPRVFGHLGAPGLSKVQGAQSPWA